MSSPIRKDTSITKDYVCQIHSIRHIELRALEKGYLQHISVDEGQHVKKGQQMFHIMPNVYEADLQKAKAEAEVAEIEYKNTKLLAIGPKLKFHWPKRIWGSQTLERLLMVSWTIFT